MARRIISQPLLRLRTLSRDQFPLPWRLWELGRLDVAASMVLLVGLIQGLIFLTIVPPWQHYDEPTHFEYAWLIANWGRLPQPGDVDYTMRREVAASMLAHDFYRNLPKPNLLTDSGEIWIGVTELVHPPAYYLWVSLPVYLTRYLPIELQLYAARCASLVLFMLTLGITLASMRELTPPGHPLRWLVPLAMALLPPFVDLMTAVNNDVGAIFVTTLFFWQALRLIRRGLTLWRVFGLALIAALALLTKNTAAVVVLLTPLAIVLAFWQQRGWPWRWLLLAGAIALPVAGLALLGWGDAARWYRWHAATSQTSTTRAVTPNAPLGRAVLRLTTSDQPRALLAPVWSTEAARLRGQPVTVGAWVWASQPVTITQPTLALSTHSVGNFPATTLPLALTQAPLFVSQVITVPQDAATVAFYVEVPPLQSASAIDVYLDGAIVLAGAYAAESPPQFAGPDGSHGSWQGRSFTNLIRNGSAEAAWPRLRPWVEHLLATYGRRSPAQTLTALFDIDRTAPLLNTIVGYRLLFSLFGTFGWAHINLPSVWWWSFVVAILGAGIGVCRWLLSRRYAAPSSLAPSLGLLGMGALLVWGNSLLRALPLLDGQLLLPVARYGFPAIVPTVLTLVGGWWTLPPRRWGWLGAGTLIALLLTLCFVSYWTIWAFYN